MGVVSEINITITGQVNADMVNIKRNVIAELEVICAKYNLRLDENE